MLPNHMQQQQQSYSMYTNAYGTAPVQPSSLLNSAANPQQQQQQKQIDEEKVFVLVQQVLDPMNREAILLELSKRRESFEDLAPVLWYSFGVMAALLQEIVSIYPALSPPTLTTHMSNRVCNALALLQCVASHPETRGPFLAANIPLFLYPFLNTVSKTRPFEYLRLTSLGVIGALVKVCLFRKFIKIYVVNRTIALKSLAFYCKPRLFRFACVLWNLERKFQKRLPSLLYKRFCWTTWD